MTEQMKEGRARVAVATKGDDLINVHFGHAEAFAVYDVDARGVRFVEQRLVEHYCQGGYGDEDKREAIVRALADCQACFVARVGDGPRETLAKARIEAVSDYPFGLIVPSIMDWYQAKQGGG